MTSGDEIWRQRLWVWLPALVFFLANASAFTVYRLGYAGNVQLLDAGSPIGSPVTRWTTTTSSGNEG